MSEAKPHLGHLDHFAMAAKDCSKLTIFHLAAPPTKDARSCKRPAKRESRFARDTADTRRLASCRFKILILCAFKLIFI